ncbi:MAG: hypothetical protein U9N54_10875 [candidate division Zixibacteria bacterium]|nr:hypothetical protein [candidate division Zixibacteria bacterium]
MLFNFINNEIEYFNSTGNSVKKIPTLFHTKWYFDAHGKKAYILDKNRFLQQILVDKQTNKVYTIWKELISNDFYLREINMETGDIVRKIDIPNHSSISNITVYSDVIFFLDKDNSFSKSTGLYYFSIN